jgi:hypothetical protein
MRERADALFVAPDAFFISRRVQFVTLAARYGIPTAHSAREEVEAGGLMSSKIVAAFPNSKAADEDFAAICSAPWQSCSRASAR